MNGHDSNSPMGSNPGSVQGAPNTPVSPPAPAVPQGIFSSGDLGINTENLPPELGGPAPKQPQQPQPAPQPNAPAQPQSPLFPSDHADPHTTVDIQLPSSSPRKKSKAPLIVALIVLILAGAGATLAYGVFNGWFTPPEEPPISVQDAYHNLMSSINDAPNGKYKYSASGPNYSELTTEGYAENPPTTEEANERFLFVAFNYLESDQLKNYYQTVADNYQTFINAANTSESEELKTLLPMVEETFPAILEIARLPATQAEIISLLYANRAAEAKRYVTSRWTTESENAQINDMMSYFNSYLEREFDIYQIYKNHNCLRGDNYDQLCVNGIVNHTLDSLSSASISDYSLLEMYLGLYKSTCLQRLESIKIALENFNA